MHLKMERKICFATSPIHHQHKSHPITKVKFQTTNDVRDSPQNHDLNIPPVRITKIPNNPPIFAPKYTSET
jgi:hypothetical protein